MRATECGGGSVERNCRPANKNPIKGRCRPGRASQKPRSPRDQREAAKTRRSYSEGVRTYRGRSRPVRERATVSSRSEKSTEAVVVGGKAAKPTRRRRAERERMFQRHAEAARIASDACGKQDDSRKGAVKPRGPPSARSSMAGLNPLECPLSFPHL